MSERRIRLVAAVLSLALLGGIPPVSATEEGAAGQAAGEGEQKDTAREPAGDETKAQDGEEKDAKPAVDPTFNTQEDIVRLHAAVALLTAKHPVSEADSPLVVWREADTDNE